MIRLRTLALLLGDIVLIYFSYFWAAWLLISINWFPDLTVEFFFLDDRGFARTSIVVLNIVAGMYMLGLYDHIRVYSRRRLIEDLLLVLGTTFLLQALISYSRSGYELSRWMMLTGSSITILIVTLWRSIYSTVLLNIVGKQKVLFLGDSPLARTIASYIIEHPERGFECSGCVTHTSESGFPGNIIFPQDQDLFKLIADIKPDRISVSTTLELNHTLTQELLKCSMSGLSVESIGDLHEVLFGRVALSTVSLNQLVFSPSFRPQPWVILIQEVYGRIIAATGLLLCWPIMLLTALAVRLNSPGPALLRQTRIGRRGVEFKLLKFRSMYVNADSISGPVRAKENDPRITTVGRWIRLTRLDELPQLINVLRGEMSLVGPRPEMPELEKQLLKDIPLYPQRHRVKPGITGWAQINHEPEDAISSTIKKLEYDLFYIKNLSPAMDFIIIFHTFKTVVFRIGAR